MVALVDVDALKAAWTGEEPAADFQPGAPEFIIEELDGTRRRLVFDGHSLPLADGVAWPTKQRRKKVWYAGNPEATVQVLGPQEDSTTFVLRLDRRWIGGNQAEVFLEAFPATFEFQHDPLELALLLQDICRGGQELRVTWGPITRRGLMDVTIEPLNVNVVQVRLDCDWHAVGDPVKFVATPPFDFRQPARDLAGLISQFADAAAAPARVMAEAMDQINAALLQVDSGVNAYVKVLDQYEDLATSGRDAVQNALAIVGTVREAAVNLCDLLDIDASALTGSDDQADVWKGAAVTCKGQDLAKQMAQQADLARRELLALFGGDDVAGVEVAYAGATLQRYATTYYKDPTFWGALAAYNLLSSPILDVGTVVVIPRLDVLQAFGAAAPQ